MDKILLLELLVPLDCPRDNKKTMILYDLVLRVGALFVNKTVPNVDSINVSAKNESKADIFKTP